MIINSIEITNFRCYYGVNKISFASDNKITLIYGESGYGKTSLLQFLNWVLYGNLNFGKNDDKPLYNIHACDEARIGDKIKVSGQIDFEHLGSKYRLNRIRRFYVGGDVMSCPAYGDEECQLLVMPKGDSGFHPYPGDIATQINKILPKELSKYFLLYGEDSRTIVLDSNALKKAIHSLFGIDAYNDALSHIGNKEAKTTILGRYQLKMVKEIGTIDNAKILSLQEDVQTLYEKLELQTQKSNELETEINDLKKNRDEILKTIGHVEGKKDIEELVNVSQKSKTENENLIRGYQHDIGKIFYRAYPYLFLAQAISDTSTVLRSKKIEYLTTYRDVFVNLRRELLDETIEKNVCICGRELDDGARKHINGLINYMPPNSYIYEFGQFVSNAKTMIKKAEDSVLVYSDILDKISEAQETIDGLERSIEDKMDELKRMDELKDIVDKFNAYSKKIEEKESSKRKVDAEISRITLLHTKAEKLLQDALDKSNKANVYTADIDFFTHIADMLKLEKEEMECNVRKTINDCVRDIFKSLTTQTDLDPDQIDFINDDFSLRTTYLTGGQLSIDVYSYVIGIIMALQRCDMDTNENPIVVDAPFAFTDNIQSEHIFTTLPKVSKQTILLTLDLNKIRNVLCNRDLYDFYIIKNITQDKATIERGDIDAIKF